MRFAILALFIRGQTQGRRAVGTDQRGHVEVGLLRDRDIRLRNRVCSAAGQEADGVVLPVSRYDIADYLALSVEAVSRSFS